MKIGAVLPLCINSSYGGGDDLGRSEILFRSLDAFLQSDFIDPILVVTPQNDYQTTRDRLKNWQHLNVQVKSEDELVPQLSNHRKMRGWRKQQVIKIAVSEYFKNDFYITFDADIICLKPIDWSDLIVEGKAILQYEKRSLHPKWWKASARILDMDANVGNLNVGMTVTPAILSTEIARRLISELEAFGPGHWVDNLCSLHNPQDPKNWRLKRFLQIRWTEYSLYYLCAHKHQLLDQFHVTAGTENVPQQMLVQEKTNPFEEWDIKTSCSMSNPGLFCCVGSKNRVPPDKVWQKVSEHIPDKFRKRT